MQELTFEQVEVVVGGSKIKDMERMNEARKASQNNMEDQSEGGGYASLGSGSVSCCSFGPISIDLFSVNTIGIITDAAIANAERINASGGVRSRL